MPPLSVYLILLQDGATDVAADAVKKATDAGNSLVSAGVGGTIAVLLVMIVLLIIWWRADKKALLTQVGKLTDSMAEQRDSATQELMTTMKDQHERELQFVTTLGEVRRGLEHITAQNSELRSEVSGLRTQIAAMGGRG